jgi:hypothetical protein
MLTDSIPPIRAVLKILVALTAATVVFSPTSSSYELATHGLLTYKAFATSGLRQGSDLRGSLGVEVYEAATDPEQRKSPLGATYFDFVGIDVRVRQANALASDGKPFDKTKMVSINRPDMTTEFSADRDNLLLPGWLMRGAIREDDDSNKSEPNPKDDPFDPLHVSHRVLSHFYDPISAKGLNSAGVELGLPAPAWAIGVAPSNLFSTYEEDTGRINHFTIYDAREALYRALTGQAKAGQVVAPAQADRKAYWATTFRALGDVVHLIQDMAQPQHTRNERHAGLGPYALQPAGFGHKSVFEAYVEARAVGASGFDYAMTPDNKLPVNIISLRPLRTDGYPIPRYDRYSDYFSTAPSTGIAAGTGMADYSNRGFFTAGKNFNDKTYPLPSRNAADYQVVAVQPVAWNGTPINSVAPVYLYKGTVPDSVSPQLTASGVPLTTVSVWDEFLLARHARPTLSLNYMNYDAAADLLLPRAVAYSAGLIDYFFRGRLEISLPDEGVYGAVDHSVENQPYTNGFR